jgi:mRNA interferase RelE/StbE
MKTSVFAHPDARALDRLPADVRERIDVALFAYVLTGLGDVKRLQGVGATRLRVGDYRIVFEEDAHVLTVRAIGDRRDVYR